MRYFVIGLWLAGIGASLWFSGDVLSSQLAALFWSFPAGWGAGAAAIELREALAERKRKHAFFAR